MTPFFPDTVFITWIQNQVALHRTCRATMSRPLVLILGDSCVPATVNFLQYHVTGSMLMIAGLFSVAGPLELSPGFYPGPDHQCRLFQAPA